MEVYRLSREKYADRLSGVGAKIKGARWNSPGVEMIYTAANRSLAMAEVAVHLTLGTLSSDFIMMTVFIPDDLDILTCSLGDLPEHWNIFPGRGVLTQYGDAFVSENKYAVMKVPSVVTKGDFNYLINPLHEGFKDISIINKSKFPFDQRLFV